jgi:hypothetical protein
MRLRFPRSLAYAGVLALLVVSLHSPATAQIARFDGIDPGAGAGAPRPNSDAAAASFDAAASSLAPLTSQTRAARPPFPPRAALASSWCSWFPS